MCAKLNKINYNVSWSTLNYSFCINEKLFFVLFTFIENWLRCDLIIGVCVFRTLSLSLSRSHCRFLSLCVLPFNLALRLLALPYEHNVNPALLNTLIDCMCELHKIDGKLPQLTLWTRFIEYASIRADQPLCHVNFNSTTKFCIEKMVSNTKCFDDIQKRDWYTFIGGFTRVTTSNTQCELENTHTNK